MSTLKVKKIKSTDNGPLILDGTIIISGMLITNNVIISGNTCNCSGNTDNISSININNSNLITTKDINSVDINNSNLINTQNLSSVNIENSNLITTQNLSSVNIENSNLINTNILSANTINVNNSNINNLTSQNIESNNIDTNNINVNESINAKTYYGDGSNLSGIPFEESLGQNSLKQKGFSYDKSNFGLSSSSLGDYNESNGNYSVTLGYNNTAGSKPYDFLPSYSGKYGIILDSNAAKDFSTQQTPQSLSTTAITTGITVYSSTTLISNTVIIQNGISGCTRYYLQNNKDENFTVVYTDCDTGLSARTTLNAFSNIEVCSLTRPCIDHYRALDIKLFENGSPLVLGNNILENQLINYALCQGYNVIQIYGLYGIFANVALSARLEIFLNKLYSVGLLPVAIMGCGTAGFDLVYLWEVGRSCKFWGVNKECEFWNGQEPFATWINSINYINTTYPNRWNVSAYVANPGGGNWGAPEAAQMIAANMDVIQCTNYVSNLAQREPNPADADFLSRDLQLLANAAKNANVIQDFVPLWSSEPVFAGPYFGSFPPNLTVPINRYNLRYNNLNFNNEDSVCKIGFNMFRYEEIINYLPYSLCNVVGTGLTPTTSYGELSGHTKIIDIIPITGCCNAISYTTYSAITNIVTIITGTTQIIPSNNPLCIKYAVRAEGPLSRPVRIFYTNCNTGRRSIYWAPVYHPSANTVTYICSLTEPFADPRTNQLIYNVGIKPFSPCCDCLEYTMKAIFSGGTPLHPLYLNYTPCGQSSPINVPYNYGDVVCMSPVNFNTYYFQELTFMAGGPIYTVLMPGFYFLETTNNCCGSYSSNTYVISTTTATTINIYTITACTNLVIANIEPQNDCNVYVIQNNTFFNFSFSYINCNGELEYVKNLPNPFEEIRICSLVEPTIYLNPFYESYLNNIIITNLGEINKQCVNFEFTKIESESMPSNIYWTDCNGTLQSATIKNIGDKKTVCLINNSQRHGSDISGNILGECVDTNLSLIEESFIDPNIGLTTITENVYNNCEVYDEYNKIFYPLNVVSIETGYSDDGTIKILDDVLIYSGLTGGTSYTVLEFKDPLPGDYLTKIIGTSFAHSAVATGNNTLAKGNYSFSQNKDTKAYGESSHAEGLETISNGIGSHSEGYRTITNGDYSHAEGLETISNGLGSHSEGYKSITNGDYSKSTGINAVSGSKEYNFNTIIDGKYIILFEDVKEQFTTGNLSTVITATTFISGTTVITSSTTTTVSELIGGLNNNCINYSVANNTSNPLPFTYTDCSTGTLTSTTIGMYSMSTICSLTTPTYPFYPWMSAFGYPVGIVEIGTCCNNIRRISAITENIITTIVTGVTTSSFLDGCNKYTVHNNLTFPLEIYYYDCSSGFTVTLLTGNGITTVCALEEPKADSSYGLTAITTTLISNECCTNYWVSNPYWCPLTVYYRDCTTGIVSTAIAYGYSSVNICSNVYPTYTASCSSSYTGVYPTITVGQNTCGHQIQNVILYSSQTSNTTIVVTTACTNNTYFTASTGCTNYLITNYVPNDPNGFGPLIVYTNCLGGYEGVQPTLGQTLTICSSNVPIPSIWPSLSAFSNNLIIVPTGTCETLCVKYRFTRISPPPSINGVWDYGYNDCDYNFQVGSLRRVGDYFEACIILGSQIVLPGISAVQIDVCSQPNVVSSTYVDITTVPVIVSGNSEVNARLTNINGTKKPVNIVNIINGFTDNGIIEISGVTIYSGISGSSSFTILELSEPLSSEINSGKIISNNFGLGSTSNGIETQSMGVGSVSQNIKTKSIGDGSHAEGIETESNGIASHAGGIKSKSTHTGEFVRSGGSELPIGYAQYSLLHVLGITDGRFTSASSYIYVDGVGENIKIPNNSIVNFILNINCVVTADASGSNMYTGYTAFFNNISLMVKNSNGVLTFLNMGGSYFTTTYNDPTMHLFRIQPEQGSINNDNIELLLKIYDNNNTYFKCTWSGLITMIQTKF